MDGPDLRAWRHEPLTRGHAERLLPALVALLAEAGWTWQDVELVAVTLGPGNFTGLRAGIAVARGLALAQGCRLLGVGTLETVAQGAMARATRSALPIQVVMDARRDEFYVQRFSPALDPLTPAEVVSGPTLAASLVEPCLLVGDAGSWVRDRVACPHDMVEGGADARYLAYAARRRLAGGELPVAGTALRPLYLRPPDARMSAGASLVAAIR
jgi:tRNA threonylcarbamoyladenosine biosynthesis protein TsaB